MSARMATDAAGAPGAPARQGRHVPNGLYAGLVIAVFAGTIGIAGLTGTWQTSGRTAEGGGRVAPQGETVTEIKGWMAVGEVADAFSVPLDELLVAFELPADTSPATALKDLESDRFSVVALRDWIAIQSMESP
jgi:hypothetical protein